MIDDEATLVGVKRWSHRDVAGVTLTLRRPEKRNPLDHATVKALFHHVNEADEDDDVRVVVITGSGSSFSAGGDLRGYLDLYQDPVRFRLFLEDFRGLCAMLERSSLVTCAMINGACVAGGLEIALACDLITIASDALIGDGHLSSGQLPGAGGSQRLMRAIGPQKAKELLLTGSLYSAADAEAMGLVNLIAEPGQLAELTLNLVTSCGRHSQLGYGLMKELIQAARSLNLDDGLDTEQALVANYATTSHDAREGLTAFLDGRRPQFKGE